MSQSRNRKAKRLPPPSPQQRAMQRVAQQVVLPRGPAGQQPTAQQRKRRLRSTYVVLGSVGTLFAGLCLYGVVRDRDDDRTCVDANNNVVSNRDCENGSSGGGRWYYGGFNTGGKMNGGSFERAGFGGHGGGGS